MTNGRNTFERNGLVLERLDMLAQVTNFSCGEKDLDDYFCHDSVKHRMTLFTQSYVLYLAGDKTKTALALVDFCNDALDSEVVARKDQKQIAYPKRYYKSYPAVKIARLGVVLAAQRKHIGSALLSMIKEFFVSDNRSGCRLLTVDAYSDAVPFYKKNGFVETIPSCKKGGKGKTSHATSTVSLFFDLMRIVTDKQ